MFTGIVEEIGKIKRITRRGKGLILEVQAKVLSSKANTGDSVAINGVCLTVMEKGRDSLIFYASQESLSRTNLSKVKVGDRVNLESALTLDKPLGGHIVQGHIDGVGRIKRITRKGEELRMEISVDKEFMPYLASKGSVAVEGISLTVARLLRDGFEVVIIPYTYENTNLKFKKIGDLVNIELDVLAKYALQVMRYG
ncbi:riboflavin synthase [bacterium]|nr:riboflavin synthase [bacterium]